MQTLGPKLDMMESSQPFCVRELHINVYLTFNLIKRDMQTPKQYPTTFWTEV